MYLLSFEIVAGCKRIIKISIKPGSEINQAVLEHELKKKKQKYKQWQLISLGLIPQVRPTTPLPSTPALLQFRHHTHWTLTGGSPWFCSYCVPCQESSCLICLWKKVFFNLEKSWLYISNFLIVFLTPSFALSTAVELAASPDCVISHLSSIVMIHFYSSSFISCFMISNAWDPIGVRYMSVTWMKR